MQRFLSHIFLLLAIALLVPPKHSTFAVQAFLYPTPGDAFQAALDAYNTRHAAAYSIVLSEQSGSLAYASAVDSANAENVLVLLAAEEPGQGWAALVPGESPAAGYNRLLASFPDALIDEATKALLRQPEQLDIETPSLALANYTGHKLPWPYGITAYVTQKDTTYHMNQIDFDIQGLAASGDVVATRPGTVVFIKESSSTTCSTPAPDPCWKKSNMVVIQHDSGEYSWYVHLVYNSVPVTLGQYVDYGTKIGVEGRTGYSTGIHLHYMASSGHTTWTNPTNPDDAPWATGINAVDFAEYSWAELVPTISYTYTSQNASDLPSPCPGAGGVLLYRSAQYQCAGQLENSGYVLRTGLGFQNLPASLDNNASSVRVPTGKSVLLYADTDRGGGKKCFDAPGDADFTGDTFDSGASLDNQVSSFEVFPAPGCPAVSVDLIAPTGSLTSPSAGATVTRSVELGASAGDAGSGVQMVRFIAGWGGQPSRVIDTDRVAPYAYTWDLCAAGIPDGAVTLSLEVVDNAWNTYASPSRTVTKSGGCAAPAAVWSADFWPSTNFSGSPVHLDQAGAFLFYNWAGASPAAGIPADGWSARFTRTTAFTAGEYRFHCQSSDGCRVFIDGQERISNWQDADFAGADWTGALTAGSHEIKVEYYDNTGDARLEAWWQGPGFLPRDANCAGDQWCLDAWGNADLAGTAPIHRDAGELLSYTWGSAGPDPLFPAVPFSTRAARSAYFDCGAYRFTATTAGGLRFWLDDTLWIDQWSEPAGTTSRTAEITIGPDPGAHMLKVEHFESASPGELSLTWAKTGACSVNTATTVAYTTTEYTRPGAAISPSVQFNITAGYLDPARGDRLALVSGSDLSATTSPGVRSFVSAGQSYTFDSSLGFNMTAPLTPGTYSGSWQVTIDGSPVGQAAAIQAIVDNQAPQVSFTAPSGYLAGSFINIQVDATDSSSGISHVQFFAGYDTGSGWSWHSLGYDTSSSGGWNRAWNPSGVPDQANVAFFAFAWDRSGNGNGKRSGSFTLDRTPPVAALANPAPTQDSTRFLVEWSLSDNFSGLSSWDIQYQLDGSPTWQDWLMNQTGSNRSAWFTGVLDHDYAFRIRARDVAGNQGSYVATSSTHINACTPNDFEPDGDKDYAHTIQVEAAAEIHKICGAGDADWFVFTPDPATSYIISTNQLAPTTDTALTLFKADGSTVLAENGSAGGAQYAVVVARPTGDPTLYVRIRHTDPLVAGDAVTYNLSVVPVRAALSLPVVSR